MANECNPCKDNIFKTISSSISTSGKPVVVVGDDNFIFVQKVEDADKITYEVSYAPYTPLSINTFTTDLSLQLKGNTVASFNLNWTYNKSVETQSLDNGLTAPTTVPGQFNYTLNVTGQNITSDITYTLTADDSTSDGNAAKTKQASILFGNYIYQAQIEIDDRLNIDATVINGLTLDGLTKTLARVRALTFTCTSNANQYEAIFMPTAYGLTSGGQFKDVATNFTGGWSKILTMNLTNSAGFTESYDIFVSSNKNLNGLTFQIS